MNNKINVEQNNMCDISNFFPHIIINIFKFLDNYDFYNFAISCKNTLNVCNNNVMCKNKFEKIKIKLLFKKILILNNFPKNILIHDQHDESCYVSYMRCIIINNILDGPLASHLNNYIISISIKMKKKTDYFIRREIIVTDSVTPNIKYNYNKMMLTEHTNIVHNFISKHATYVDESMLKKIIDKCDDNFQISLIEKKDIIPDSFYN